MKTITKTYNVYEYRELSDNAKEKVKRWYLNDEIRYEIIDACDANGWYFDKDGNFFAA